MTSPVPANELTQRDGGPTVPSPDMQTILRQSEAQDWRCSYCGQEMSPAEGIDLAPSGAVHHACSDAELIGHARDARDSLKSTVPALDSQVITICAKCGRADNEPRLHYYCRCGFDWIGHARDARDSLKSTVPAFELHQARVDRVLAAYAEMDALHKSMYPRDGGPPDAKKELRADGLCLGLADSAFVFADELIPALLDEIEQLREALREAYGELDGLGYSMVRKRLEGSSYTPKETE